MRGPRGASSSSTVPDFQEVGRAAHPVCAGVSRDMEVSSSSGTPELGPCSVHQLTAF